MSRPTASALLPPTLFPLGGAGAGGSVVFLPDYGGNVLYARPLVPLLGAELRCLGLRLTPSMLETPGGPDLAALGRSFAADIRAAGLARPLHLVGFSFAGILAFETARYLADGQADVDGGPTRLWLIDTHIHRLFLRRYALRGLADLRREAGHALRWFLKNRRRLLTGRSEPDVLDRYRQLRFELDKHPHAYRLVIRMLYESLARYRPRPWNGSATVLRARRDSWPNIPDDLGWSQLIRGSLTTIPLHADHLGLLRRDDLVQQVAQIILNQPHGQTERQTL